MRTEHVCIMLVCLELYEKKKGEVLCARFRKSELVLVLFVRLFDFRLSGFVCFLFLLVSRMGCGL